MDGKPEVTQQTVPPTPSAVPVGTDPKPAVITPATVVKASPAVIAAASRPTSLAGAVNAAQSKSLPVPKGLSLFNTRELTSGFFHGCIYSETAARKTVTAAQFGTPEDVRIVLTRRKEQLIPLRELGYEAALVENDDALLYALQYPERIWPDWAQRPDRTLILDDATEAVAMLLEGAEDELASRARSGEVRDQRRTYREAGGTLKEAVKIVLAKPQHFIMTALAKVRENSITNEERISPDLPPSMLNLLLTELEYVFYINKRGWYLITETDFLTVSDVDPVTGKERTFRREIFAKNKLPLNLVGKNVLLKQEKLDLADIWRRVKAGKPATTR